MNANEVNTVIDNICTKLGVADGSAQNLWQELPKYLLCQNISYLLFSIVFIAVFVATFLYFRQRAKDDDTDIGAIAMIVVSVIAILICVLEIIDATVGIIACINAPNATTFEYIIDAFK